MQGEEGEILDCFTFDLEKPKFLVAYFVICQFPLISLITCKSLKLLLLQYSVNNLQFALTLEPDNLRIQKKLAWARNQWQAGQATIPSTIEDELETNPFMRVDLPEIQVCHLSTPSTKCEMISY